jgi:hypothetical protein
MYVSGLWRYPIKSLGGESLTHARLTHSGVDGDRVGQVVGAHGVLTRNRDRLRNLNAQTSADGVPLVDGELWTSGPARVRLREIAGPGVRFAGYSHPELLGALNLLVASDGAVNASGEDLRRHRPHLLIAEAPLGCETSWAGSGLAIGEALIGVRPVQDPRTRQTVDSDDTEDIELADQAGRVGGGRALNCWTIAPGVIGVGDDVELVPARAMPW